MNDDYDAPRDRDKKKTEPSLKDALMPEKPERSKERGRSRSRDTYGETPSLQDALLPKDHTPSPPAPMSPTPPEAPQPEKPAPTAQKAQPDPQPSNYVVQTIVACAIVIGFVVVFFVGRMSAPKPLAITDPSDTSFGAVAADSVASESETPSGNSEHLSQNEAITGTGSSERAPSETVVDWGDPGPMGMAAIQEQGLIIDVHEHIESLEEAPKFLSAMDALGIQKICLMGTSKFTLTLNERFGFTEYDENNEELIKIIEAYPGSFEAWPTIDPKDPETLSKIQSLVAGGATGVKLYLGHGYVSKDQTYMFHTIAMDDPTLLPFYAWCQENGIPLAFHVNPYKDKVGFAQEFVAVLTQFPDLKVIAPHFILSSVQSYRLEEYLDTFPNLYSDVSFGDYFMKERLTYISKEPAKFRRLFREYPNRFMFASDLVMIKGRPDDWAPRQMQAYLDMLSKKTYTSADIPGVVLNGLDLSDELLSRILFRNYLEFRAKQPKGTRLTREIDWSRMNVDPVERDPGETFPPLPKKR